MICKNAFILMPTLRFKTTSKIFQMRYCMQIFLNPKKGGGGLNQPTETLKACRAVLDEGMIFKPSCKFHFWCLLTTEKMTLGVV